MAAVGALGAWAAVEAFSVQNFTPDLGAGAPITFHSNPNHEDVTRRALSNVIATLSDGSTVQFTDKAREHIAQKVAETDSLYYDIEKVHFDSETFFDGQVRLQDMRKSVGLWAYTGKFDWAQETLSQALHTVEDFYAHSTWVEQNPLRTDVANLGRPGSITTPVVGGQFIQAVSIPTCSSQATQTLFANQTAIQTAILSNSGGVVPLTSEFFGITQEVAPNFDWRFSNSKQKCIHGVSDMNNNSSKRDNTGFTAYGHGINKDDIARDFFPQARMLAIVAAQQYVNDILGDIRANNTATDADNAICGLLGHHPLTLGPDSMTCATVKLQITPANPAVRVNSQTIFSVSALNGGTLPANVAYQWSVTGAGSFAGVNPLTTQATTVSYVAPATSETETLTVEMVDSTGNVLGSATTKITIGTTGSQVCSPLGPFEKIYPDGRFTWISMFTFARVPGATQYTFSGSLTGPVILADPNETAPVIDRGTYTDPGFITWVPYTYVSGTASGLALYNLGGGLMGIVAYPAADPVDYKYSGAGDSALQKQAATQAISSPPTVVAR